MPRPFAPLLYGLFLSIAIGVGSGCTHSSSRGQQSTPEVQPPASLRSQVSVSGPTMGVQWHVTVSITTATESRDIATLQPSIQEALARVDERMSTYKPDSEISRFANAPAGTEFQVSAETANVVREAQRIAELSDGAFDATVMPLVDLWGFGPTQSPSQAPSADELIAALEISGWQKLHVQESSLRKDVEGLRLDLSAIAKGYGVDAVCAALRENGYTDFMVEVGGEVRTAGLSTRRTAWRIGIDAPQDMSVMGQNLQAVLELGDIAVATSGDYRNFRIVDGQRISHTIDPRTGLPVKHNLASITILAPNCMLADALATACMVLGPEDGLKLIESISDVECYMVLRDGEQLVARQSAGFPELTE